MFAFKRKTFSVGRLNVYYGVAIVSLFVIAEELSQAFIPSRTFDYADLSADAAGILLAVGLAYLLKKPKALYR